MNAKWLIPVDGSETALRAVDYAIAETALYKSVPQIVLVNVQAALPSDVTRFVSGNAVQDFHRESGEKALGAARARLDAASLAYSSHILIGDAAAALVEFADAQSCTQIVIGARGLGSVVGLLLGSVANKVVQLTGLPVVLVK